MHIRIRAFLGQYYPRAAQHMACDVARYLIGYPHSLLLHCHLVCRRAYAFPFLSDFHQSGTPNLFSSLNSILPVSVKLNLNDSKVISLLEQEVLTFSSDDNPICGLFADDL